MAGVEADGWRGLETAEEVEGTTVPILEEEEEP